MRNLALAISALFLAACDQLPRDPEGSLDRIRQSGLLRVGIAGPSHSAAATRLVAALAAQTGTHPRLRRGSLEPLIADLDADRLDLIIAEMSESSPWMTRIAPGPALRVRNIGEERLEERALAKNGENRWIVLMETASRRIANSSREISAH